MVWNTEMANSTLLIFLSSIITGWFYNRANGSILVAGIIHAAENTFLKLLLNLDWTTYLVLQAFVVLVIILVDRMWKRLPSDHPAVYQTPGLDGQSRATQKLTGDCHE